MNILRIIFLTIHLFLGVLSDYTVKDITKDCPCDPVYCRTHKYYYNREVCHCLFVKAEVIEDKTSYRTIYIFLCPLYNIFQYVKTCIEMRPIVYHCIQ